MLQVYLQNAFCAAPVHVSKAHLAEGNPRYLIINTGNANAATGPTGLKNAQDTCAKLAELAGVEQFEVLPFSTGVIGEQLPMERLVQGIQPALNDLNAAWADAASGIMTTDTHQKVHLNSLSLMV
jgi:glutamate N-acetyltransferase/amino-acid N-acetyltransferase